MIPAAAILAGRNAMLQNLLATGWSMPVGSGGRTPIADR
jgi:hypothetical protein